MALGPTTRTSQSPRLHQVRFRTSGGEVQSSTVAPERRELLLAGGSKEDRGRGSLGLQSSDTDLILTMNSTVPVLFESTATASVLDDPANAAWLAVLSMTQGATWETSWQGARRADLPRPAIGVAAGGVRRGHDPSRQGASRTAAEISNECGCRKYLILLDDGF